MPRPKPTPLSFLAVVDLKALLAEKEIDDLKALLAEKEIEVLKERQAELEADLRRVEKKLARLVKGAAVAKLAPKPPKHAASKPGAKKAGKKAAAAKATAKPAATVETVVVDLLKANGAPMTTPEIVATIKKRKLVKTKAANFAGVVRQMLSKSSKVKRVGRGVYRA